MQKSAIKWGNAIHNGLDQCLMNEDELVLLRLASLNHNVIEIGSYRGGSSIEIAKYANRLDCIDPWDDIDWGTQKFTGESVYNDFRLRTYPFKNIHVHRFKSDEFHPHINNWNIDVLFIDGDHSYEQCLKDLQNYVPKLSGKGVILVHDYCWMFGGVMAACLKYFGRVPDGLVNTLAIYYL